MRTAKDKGNRAENMALAGIAIAVLAVCVGACVLGGWGM
ncbi:hypothetical protein Dalk_4571 [Desulfatibacillum aliphaticivorans]|uniref:Uncharacterized protein n=1 Tax=Desulfatibacillum aliphaticivorans TaxID=218208 RepID=B8FNG8_DESAL|nr:hypothetical protein Dalk_4571 [Desulfatibacillum aliphaticivorans]